MMRSANETIGYMADNMGQCLRSSYIDRGTPVTKGTHKPRTKLSEFWFTTNTFFQYKPNAGRTANASIYFVGAAEFPGSSSSGQNLKRVLKPWKRNESGSEGIPCIPGRRVMDPITACSNSYIHMLSGHPLEVICNKARSQG